MFQDQPILCAQRNRWERVYGAESLFATGAHRARKGWQGLARVLELACARALHVQLAAPAPDVGANVGA